MSRNANNHFSVAPAKIDMPRSSWTDGHSHKTTFDVGQLIPIDFVECMPGDTIKLSRASLIRLQTLITPIMDDLRVDVYSFFVPHRLVWENFEKMMGEADPDAWTSPVEYTIPQVSAPSGGWNVGTLASYYGVPPYKEAKVSAIPFRGYAKIVNDWFRDQNLTEYINLPLNDSDQTGSNGSDYINDIPNGGVPFVAAKLFDQFTSCLPAPQKGEPVAISLGTLTSELPVVGNGIATGFTDGTKLGAVRNNNGLAYESLYGKDIGDTTAGAGQLANAAIGIPTKSQLGDHLENSGMVAIFDGVGENLITINELREAFQVQKFLERQALGGSRYNEIIKSFFSVETGDARLQRAEYIGGSTFDLNVNQVVQTSETNNTPQGNTAAYSLTTESHDDYTYSVREHGAIHTLCVVRYRHSYQQGLPRFFSKKTKFDFYWPIFANLGNVGVKNSEIYLQDDTVVDADTGEVVNDQVFGFQEAWFEYRYHPNRISGELLSQYATSLDVWHLGDNYSQLPTLSDAWIREDKTNLDRALAVNSSVSNQILADFYFTYKWTRPMPLYSVPGLIDHH